MTSITMSTEAALRPEFIEGVILEKMNPKMSFLNLFPLVNLHGASSFKHYRDEQSAEDEILAGKLGEPVPLSEEANLSEIEVEPIQSELGDTKRFGYKLRFSKDIARENGKIDMVLRAYDRAAYGMLRVLNNAYLNTIISNAQATPITLNDGSWKTSEKIEEDVIDMQESFDILGYNYNLTSMFTYKKAYYGVKKYYNLLEEKFTPNDIMGSALYKADELTQNLIGLDLNVKPITTYYNVDEKYSKIAGSFINVDKYTEQSYPKDSIIEIWAEMGIGVHHPKAMLYQTGI